MTSNGTIIPAATAPAIWGEGEKGGWGEGGSGEGESDDVIIRLLRFKIPAHIIFLCGRVFTLFPFFTDQT